MLAVAAVDGGLGRPGGDDVPRAELRERLRPPATALPPDRLVAALASGPLARWWSDEVADAVLPIFAAGEDGLARARLPLDRHLQVVDALLDAEPLDVLARVTCPAWLVACEPEAAGPDPARARRLEEAARAAHDPRVLRWGGAVHDVPLQWPALVAGLVEAVVEEAAHGAAHQAAPAPPARS